MADNTQISLETTGDIVATDDIEGVKYQRMKITLGADGVNDGDLSDGNPMPTRGDIYISGISPELTQQDWMESAQDDRGYGILVTAAMYGYNSAGTPNVDKAIPVKVNPSGVIASSITDAVTGASAQVIARTQTPTGNALQVQIGPGDPISNVPVTIDFPHHQIHEGESHLFFWTGTLNGTKDFRLSVPAFSPTIRAPHIVPEVISDAATTTLSLYEGTTWTAGGVENTAKYNRNRNYAATIAAMKIYETGVTALTVNALGTRLYAGYLMASTKATNMTDRGLSEWVLAASTEYLFRIVTSASGTVLFRLDWYEDLGV